MGGSPPSFTFVLKASRRITHQARLGEAADGPLQYLWDASAALGDHRGPILFQLPPTARKDIDRLRRFLAALPDGMRPAFEFRHESWADDEVQGALAERGAALCAADTEDGEPELVPTAAWGYLRLRRTHYTDAQLATWAERVRAQPWQDVFVFFKHEDEPTAPRYALRFRELFERGAD